MLVALAEVRSRHAVLTGSHMGNLYLFKTALVLTAVVKTFGYVALYTGIFHFPYLRIFLDEILIPS